MDIREILAALSTDDKALWSEQRTAMRRAFLTAHNMTVGIGEWTDKDDAFVDLIDIQLALLFDRAGRLMATKQIIGMDKADTIVEDINAQISNLHKVDNAVSKIAANEWTGKVN
jgi:hypothetical protein